MTLTLIIKRTIGLVKPNKIHKLANCYSPEYVKGWNDCIKRFEFNQEHFANPVLDMVSKFEKAAK